MLSHRQLTVVQISLAIFAMSYLVVSFGDRVFFCLSHMLWDSKELIHWGPSTIVLLK